MLSITLVKSNIIKPTILDYNDLKSILVEHPILNILHNTVADCAEGTMAVTECSSTE